MIRIGVTGLIGYETAARLLKEHESELRERFSAAFLRDFEQLAANGAVALETAGSPADSGTALLERKNLLYCLPIGTDGLTGALWAACEAFSTSGFTGCRVFLEDIPVRQEVIEITERYEENPYETASGGAMLLLWEEDSAGIPEGQFPGLPEPYHMDNVNTEYFIAEIIGYLTRDRERLLIGKAVRRYLTPPERQNKDTEERKRQTRIAEIRK